MRRGRSPNPRPTQTQREAYAHASKEFKGTLARLRTLIETDLRRLKEAMHEAGAPWIPGLIPDWERK